MCAREIFHEPRFNSTRYPDMKATYRTIKSTGRTGMVSRKAAAMVVSKVMAAKTSAPIAKPAAKRGTVGQARHGEMASAGAK